MEQYLTWTKGIFESTYQLFQDGQIKGSLFFDTWKNEAHGIVPGKNIRFNTIGFSDPSTQIILDNKEQIATIKYHIWQTAATVNFNDGTRYEFKFTNSWYTQFIITDLKGKQVSYDSDTSSGRIIANTDDEVMLLAGLYIKEYFGRSFMLLMLIILFIPILMNGIF